MVKLFDSLMRNYPIQTLLFWRTSDEIKAREFMGEIDWDRDLSSLYRADVSEKYREKTFVLDGQQRLQTLYGIFAGAVFSAGKRREAYLDVTSGGEGENGKTEYKLEFSEAPLELPWYRLGNLMDADAQRDQEEIADSINDALDEQAAQVLPEHGPDSKSRNLRHKLVRRNLAQLVSLLREEKHFWIQELDGVANAYPYGTILDIFVRVNSGGTKLDASDLMFAAMKEGWDEIEVAIEETTEFLNGTNLSFDKTFPLKCLLVVHGRGAETSPEKFAGLDGKKLLAEMKEAWPRAEQAFQELRDFLKNDLKIYADKVVRSYNSFVVLFDYLYHNPQPDERSRAYMRAYYYKAQLFGWYSQSTDSVLNALHGIVGTAHPTGFPMQEVKDHFSSRGVQTVLYEQNLNQTRLRFILLNLVYVDNIGDSSFEVKFKGNEPHIDYIYPKHALLHRLGMGSAEVNAIGNFRFVGAADNIRKRGEFPASYFGRLKQSGVPIERHLLIESYATDPQRLEFDVNAYRDFRDKRAERIWIICNKTVNPELG